MELIDLINASRFKPDHLAFPDAWVGHIPFGAWLIKTLKPSIFVELGTHSGNSYLAFCQAIHETKLQTLSYAIDTWKGDEQAGFYGEDVYGNLKPYHDDHYGNFSNLMRMTFDEAVSYFADQSVELLHIDGLHTYDAVKHDFETWLPKLSTTAVVLFHDTNVREREFGIWKFWLELCKQYPLNFEFVHSHGLGVIQLSEAKGNKNLEWLNQDNENRTLIKEYFSALGEHVINQYRQIEANQLLNDTRLENERLNNKLNTLQAQIAEHEQLIEALRSQLTEKEQALQDFAQQVSSKNEAIARLQAQIAEHAQLIEALHSQLAEKEQALQDFAQQVSSKNEAIARLQAQIAEHAQLIEALHSQLTEKEQALQDFAQQVSSKNEAIASLQAQIAEHENSIHSLNSQLENRDQQIQILNREIVDYTSSTSWKITRPLRRLSSLVRRK